MPQALPGATRDRKVYSVAELTRLIKGALEREFGTVWVEGEMSNLRRPPSGHIYFTIKDESAQLSVVMFRGDQIGLAFNPADGTAVQVYGPISVYERSGQYQIIARILEEGGTGALQAAFEKLKKKLFDEGLFDADRKKALPLLPRRIGVVTSPTGAAVRDILTVLRRRFPNLNVIIVPVKVQGDEAAGEIAAGINALNQLGDIDVMIVGRGGGSLEDLWAFNEEIVARAIERSAIPVISAVGHEIDITISDLAADVRAATPSAAAEIVVERKEDFQRHVTVLKGRLDKAILAGRDRLEAKVQKVAAHQAFMAVRHGVERRSQQVDEADYRIRGLVERRLATLAKRLDETTRRLEAQRMDHKLGQARATLQALSGRLDAAELKTREGAHRTLGRLGAKLDALSPLGVLGRGYSLTWTAQGKLLRRAADAAVGDAVRVDLDKGSLHCRVEDKDDERTT